MGPLGVVLLEPRRDHDEGLVAAGEPVMPEALLFQRAEEALDHPVLLRRVRRDVLLVEPVPAHDAHKDLRAEHEAVVGPQGERCMAILDPRSRSASSSVAASPTGTGSAFAPAPRAPRAPPPAARPARAAPPPRGAPAWGGAPGWAPGGRAAASGRAPRRSFSPRRDRVAYIAA